MSSQELPDYENSEVAKVKLPLSITILSVLGIIVASCLRTDCDQTIHGYIPRKGYIFLF
jgi:hypothetical protein